MFPLYSPLAFCLLLYFYSNDLAMHGRNKKVSFVALCAREAPFWDQSALCQELAKRRELLPQALSLPVFHLGDEMMIHGSNGCSWEN